MENKIGASKLQSENRVVDAKGKFAKGNRSGGRPRGSRNRLTVTVKELILGELHRLGPEHLHQWALDNPGDFYKIAARLIPQARELSGKDGQPIEIKRELRQYATDELLHIIGEGE